MNKIRIKLDSIEECKEFVSICNSFKSDINIYYKTFIIDAKSLVGVLNISLGEIIELQMISFDENEIVSFMNTVKKYRVD